VEPGFAQAKAWFKIQFPEVRLSSSAVFARSSENSLLTFSKTGKNYLSALRQIKIVKTYHLEMQVNS